MYEKGGRPDRFRGAGHDPTRSEMVGREEVSHFFEFLELESIRARSELTVKDAAALADDVDRVVWDRLRCRLEEH